MTALNGTKPLIGLSVAREIAPDGIQRDFVRSTYLDAIRLAGGIPVLLANIPESQDTFKQCHGLLLTGGGDFDPRRYGEGDQGTKWDGVSQDRDEAELLLIQTAYSLAMPVLGICRGIQALAVASDGTLVQDIPKRYPSSPIQHFQALPRQEVTHVVNIEQSSRLAEILGAHKVRVNSFHHQAVNMVPPHWIVSARAEDGLIEGMERPDYSYAIGVQWHPEDLVNGHHEARQLFNSFVHAARSYQEAHD